MKPRKPPGRPRRRPSDISDIPSAATRSDTDSASQSSSTMPPSTAKTVTKVTAQTLKDCNVKTRPNKDNPDALLNDLGKKLAAEVPPQPLKNLEVLCGELKGNIQNSFQHSTGELYTLLDQVRYRLDECAKSIFHPFTHDLYFKSQIKRCQLRSEHVLQRTVMMSISHPYWLPAAFDWNVEGQWHHDPWAGPFAPKTKSQDKPKKKSKSQAEAKEDSESLSRPRPDMTFAFSEGSFIGPAEDNLIPKDLKWAIAPDESGIIFPFIFVEVKRGRNDIEEAKLKNLNSASRALYNIKRWFKRAETVDASEDWKTSFLRIRVFSFAFNPYKLEVRMHRATLKSLSENPDFWFEELFEEVGYTRGQICNLFNNILNEYAANDLRESLRSAFGTVVNHEREEKEKGERERIRKENEADEREERRTGSRARGCAKPNAQRARTSDAGNGGHDLRPINENEVEEDHVGETEEEESDSDDDEEEANDQLFASFATVGTNGSDSPAGRKRKRTQGGRGRRAKAAR